MDKKISKGLKLTFLINFFVSLIFGVLLFFLVEEYMGWFGISFTAPYYFGDLFGGALLGFAIASFMAWKQTEWENVKITVIMEIAWLSLGAYIFFWWIILSPIVQPMDWIYLILFFGFLATFIFFYIQHEHEKENQTGRK